MKIISLKLLVICFMIGFGIFFAMDVANNGFSKSALTGSRSTETHPSPSPKPATVKTSDKPTDAADLGPMTAATARQKAAEDQVKPAAVVEAQQPVIVVQDSFINRLTNKIGDVLRHMAAALIDTIVTLFKIFLG